MICHYCCRGYIADGFDVRPCPECGGSGIVHCCEGERPDQCPEHSREATPKPASFRSETSSPVSGCSTGRSVGERCSAIPACAGLADDANMLL
jgi:hypothetical protein